MKKWEYNKTRGEVTQEYLDSMGDQGWELVSCDPTEFDGKRIMIWKREKREVDPDTQRFHEMIRDWVPIDGCTCPNCIERRKNDTGSKTNETQQVSGADIPAPDNDQ